MLQDAKGGSYRHSTNIIPGLDPPLRRAAVQSYSVALRVVFLCQTAVALLTLLATLPIEEHPLPYVDSLSPNVCRSKPCVLIGAHIMSTKSLTDDDM